MATVFRLFVTFLLLVAFFVPARSSGRRFKVQIDDKASWGKVEKTISERTRAKRAAATPPPPPISPGKVVNVFDLKEERSEQGLVHWTGNGSKTIFFLAQHTNSRGVLLSTKLWRSIDYGLTFNDDNGKFDQKALIDDFYVSPANGAKAIFADVVHSQIYVTEDEGSNFASHVVNFNPNTIVFHPTNAKWVLAKDTDKNELYCSTNLGATWTMMAQSPSLSKPKIYTFYWAVPGVDKKQSYVYFEVETGDGGSVRLYKEDALNPGHPTSLLGSIDTVELIPNSLVIIDEYMFVKGQVGSIMELHRSHNRGSFQRTYFASVHPFTEYSIVDATEHQVFIAVRHYSNMTNIYSSDESGRFFTLSIDNIFIIDRGSWNQRPPLIAFYRVLGARGVYLANQRHQRKVQTKISFNKGGDWQLMQLSPAAKKNSSCTSKCYVHVHIWFPFQSNDVGVSSSDSSVGLILAHGGVGEYLTLETSMLISNDSGLTWSLSFSDSDKDGNGFNFVIGDHGSYLASVEHYEKVTKIQYSCTEGFKWSDVSLEDESLVVNGFFTEPGETTEYAFAFCSRLSQNQFNNWVAIRFNFTSLLKRKCQRPADYADYTPSYKLIGSKCLLGQTTTYERRKWNHCCYNDEEYEREIKVTPCQCTEEDFECDYGYTESSSSCVQIPGLSPWDPTEDCKGKTYNKTKGYRKVAGDKCVGGKVDAYIPQELQCPDITPGGLDFDSDIAGVGAAAGKQVTFTLSLAQNKGTAKSALYRFSFGDGSDPVSVTGIDLASVQQHTFNKSGTYDVKVVVRNAAGSASASIEVEIFDPVVDVVVLPPHAVTVGVLVNFSARAVAGGTSSPPRLGAVYYYWDFDDGSSTITSNSTVAHKFDDVKEYRVSVTAHSPLSTFATHRHVGVFRVVKTLRLGFSANADSVRSLISDFDVKLSAALVDRVSQLTTNSDKSRFEAFVYPQKAGATLEVDLSVVASTAAEETSVDDILDKAAKISSVNVEGSSITITSRTPVTVNTGISSSSSSSGKPVNKLAAALAVPAFLLVVVLVVGFVWYCRRYNQLRNAYSILNQDPTDDAPLSLGADESDEEDEQQAVKFSGGRLQIQNAPADQDDDDDDECGDDVKLIDT
ncbi:VPS10 domain-containing receptor SorCS1-like [Oscarella lobularis]|uniref:VPS10 domain-containing receptor SorCS1-like n=1 Tax=Oscarella lobularis TaxID=121494 RepID=UPI0033143785